jgi:cobalamin biosynthesis protein CobT
MEQFYEKMGGKSSDPYITDLGGRGTDTQRWSQMKQLRLSLNSPMNSPWRCRANFGLLVRSSPLFFQADR